jgi:hypothetical protein
MNNLKWFIGWNFYLAMSIKDLISGKFLGFGKMAFGPLNLMR